MREFLLNKIKATGTTAGDDSFTKVKLLLPLDGADAATSTADSSDLGHTITLNGTAQLDTAQKKFGTASLLLDGNSDYLSVADHTGFDFGAADFTIECWIRFNNLFRNTIFSHFANSTSASQSLYLTHFDSSNTLRLGYHLEGGSNTDTSYSWSPSTGTWYHIAVERSGTNIKVYIDGTAVITLAVSTTALQASEDPFRIGVFNDNTTGSPTLDWYFNGWIDDFRITNGLARYAGNFTPHTTAHLIGSGDNSKHIVMNSSADGVATGTLKEDNNRIAKAWCNFNGTGTVAIRTSYNISSLVDRGSGLYSLNLSTALSEADCAGAASALDQDAGTNSTQRNRMVNVIPESTTLVYVNTFHFTNADDCEIVSAIIFGN